MISVTISSRAAPILVNMEYSRRWNGIMDQPWALAEFPIMIQYSKFQPTLKDGRLILYGKTRKEKEVSDHGPGKDESFGYHYECDRLLNIRCRAGMEDRAR